MVLAAVIAAAVAGSIGYLVPVNEATTESLVGAFGDLLTFDGTSYVIKPGVSRKQVLVPALMDMISAHPKE